MTNQSAIYRYQANLPIQFPEGLEEIKFIKEINGFNYLSIKSSQDNKTNLPEEFELSAPPPDFLEEIKKKEYLKTENLRKELQFKNIIYQNSEFSASQIARQSILGVISVLSSSPEITSYYWQDNDGNDYQFTLADFKEILRLISQRDVELYQKESEIRSFIKSLSLITDIESVNIPELWKNLS